jgi:acyl carrier protein
MVMKMRDDILKFIVQEISEVSLGRLSPGQISPEANLLDDLGLDSLDYAAIVLSTERWTGIRVMDRVGDWSVMRSAADLARLFRSFGQ